MSGRLNLIDRLLNLGRQMQRMQREREAVHYFKRLAAFRELPREVAEETHFGLSRLYLRAQRYRRARRHLDIALVYRPECARYHYLIGTALSHGPASDLTRAAEHFRKAVALAPDEPRFLAGLGKSCLRRQETEEGLGALMRAMQLAPNSPRFVRLLARSLTRAGRAEEAREVLLAARFRNPRDPRFQQLWTAFLFRQLNEGRSQRRQAGGTDGPRLLPFRRSAYRSLPLVRQDGPETLPGPRLHRPTRPFDWKHG